MSGLTSQYMLLPAPSPTIRVPAGYDDSFAVVVTSGNQQQLVPSSFELCKILTKNALAQVFGQWPRAGWLMGAAEFDASMAQALSSTITTNGDNTANTNSGFEFVACRCVSSDDADAMVHALNSLTSLGLIAAKRPTMEALAPSVTPASSEVLPPPRLQRQTTSPDPSLESFIVVVAPTAPDFANAGRSLRSWVVESNAPPNSNQPTVLGTILSTLAAPDSELGHPVHYTFPERGFASPEEFSRTFLVALDTFDRTRTSSRSDISSDALINDPFHWPPVAFDQPEDRARAVVARLVGIGFQSSCFPAANREAIVFANAVSSIANRLGVPASAPASGLGPTHSTVPSASSSSDLTPEVPMESSTGVTTLAIATMNPSVDESLALGHRGVWRDGQNMSRWCSLRDDPDPHSSVLCTHSPGTVLARPHYSCCGVGRGETCTVWRGDALPHPWHSHRLVACSHAHSDFAGWRCDGAESSAAAGGGGVCLGADRPSARRHPRGQRYRCPEPGCDFDLCECCFAGGRGEPLPEPPSSRGAFAAAGLPVEGEALAQWPSRSLVALVERAGLSTSDIVEREDLVARAGQAADEMRDAIARPPTSASRRPMPTTTAAAATVEAPEQESQLTPPEAGQATIGTATVADTSTTTTPTVTVTTEDIVPASTDTTTTTTDVTDATTTPVDTASEETTARAPTDTTATAGTATSTTRRRAREHLCEHCGGAFRRCFGAYGYVPNGAAARIESAEGRTPTERARAWRMGASTDLRDDPRSPNARWCCAACEGFATGITEAEAASEFDLDDFPSALRVAFSTMTSGVGEGGEEGEDFNGNEAGAVGAFIAAAMRGAFASGQSVVLNVSPGALPAFLQHFTTTGISDQHFQDFIGGGGNVPRGVGAATLADLAKLKVVDKEEKMEVENMGEAQPTSAAEVMEKEKVEEATAAAAAVSCGVSASEVQDLKKQAELEAAPGAMSDSGGGKPDILLPPPGEGRIVLKQLLQIGQDTCSICQEPFEVGDVVTTLPSCRITSSCRAFFHHGGDGACGGGLVKWLTAHTTCPFCRAEVPPRNDKRKRDDDEEEHGGGDGGGGGGIEEREDSNREGDSGGEGLGESEGESISIEFMGYGSSFDDSSFTNGSNGNGGNGLNSNGEENGTSRMAENLSEVSAPCFACGRLVAHDVNANSINNGGSGGGGRGSVNAGALFQNEICQCPCPAATRARRVFVHHRSFFLTAAAHVVRRVGLGEVLSAASDQRLLGSDHGADLARSGWAVARPLERFLDWSKRQQHSSPQVVSQSQGERSNGNSDQDQSISISANNGRVNNGRVLMPIQEGASATAATEGARIESVTTMSAAAETLLPDASCFAEPGADSGSQALVAWTVAVARSVLRGGPTTCSALVAQADALANDLTSDYERSLEEHGLRCDALVRGEGDHYHHNRDNSHISGDDDAFNGGFSRTARLVGRFVTRGGSDAEWAAAEARMGRLEACGWHNLRDTSRLLRNGVRDVATVLEGTTSDEGNARSATLRRYLLRVVLDMEANDDVGGDVQEGANLSARAMYNGPHAPAPFPLYGFPRARPGAADGTLNEEAKKDTFLAENDVVKLDDDTPEDISCQATDGSQSSIERSSSDGVDFHRMQLENSFMPPPPLPPRPLPLQRQESAGTSLRHAVAKIELKSRRNNKGINDDNTVAASKRCLDRLGAIAAQVRRDPGAREARRLRSSNPALAQDVLCYPAAVTALQLLGFEHHHHDEEEEDGEAGSWLLRTVDLDLFARFEGILDEARKRLNEKCEKP